MSKVIRLIMVLLVFGMIYLLFSLCNSSIYVKEWHEGSGFCLGFIGLGLIAFWSVSSILEE